MKKILITGITRQDGSFNTSRVSFGIPEYAAKVDVVATFRFLETSLKYKTRFYRASTSELGWGSGMLSTENSYDTKLYESESKQITELWAWYFN